MPRGSECLLIIPSLSTTLHGKVVLRDIRDKFGKALLQVEHTWRATPTWFEDLSVSDTVSYILSRTRREIFMAHMSGKCARDRQKPARHRTDSCP